MKVVLKILQVLLALFFVYAGIQHFISPLNFMPFVPEFLPFKMAIIYISGIVEMILGILLLIPKYAKIGATGILVLLLVFLPIHIWDVFSDDPAMGSHTAALIRLPFQFLLIGWAYFIKRFAVKWQNSSTD